MPKKNLQELFAENQELRARLEEVQETLDAIRRGEVDGLIVPTPKGSQIYSLSGAEKPYRVLIEEMREGAVMLSDDNTIMYCNRGFAGMAEYPLEKIVGINIESMVPQTYKAALKKLLSLARGGKGPITKAITLQTKVGTLVPTQMSINSLKMDSANTTFLVVTDLTQHMEEEVKRYTTELEQAQIALSESEQRWSTTLASIGDAVIATDVACKITFMNAVAEGLTGWTLSEASQKKIGQVFKIINGKTREEVENPVAKVIAKGAIIGLANHTILLRKDGIEIPVDDSGAPIKDKNGKITGVVLIFRDISQRKQLEDKIEKYTKNLEDIVKERTEKLKDAERLAAIGATAGMVGHDIRNPLQTVIGEVFMAKSEVKSLPESDAKQSLRESIDIIEEQTDYVNKIISDLQDYARPIKPIIQETSLEVLIENLILKNGAPENIKISCHIEGDAKRIKTDPDLLNRILGNLMSNSVQAMPKGGKLEVRACRDRNDYVIAVKDTGVGIPEEVKGRVFTPLFTTKPKGQGFGLAVVKRITEALGGKVFFESQELKGTTFIVRLPLSQKRNEP